MGYERVPSQENELLEQTLNLLSFIEPFCSPIAKYFFCLILLLTPLHSVK